MELTVSLGTTQQRLHPTMRDQDAVIGIVQLQQSPDNSLFVIGDTRQQMQMGLAMFTNMALQPVVPPISNKEYEFRCVYMINCQLNCICSGYFGQLAVVTYCSTEHTPHQAALQVYT
jgi:hypothetical protein